MFPVIDCQIQEVSVILFTFYTFFGPNKGIFELMSILILFLTQAEKF